MKNCEMVSIIPDVSIVIVNYNKPALTLDCVKSILHHTKGVSYEIVVVDNASTDGDIDILEGLVAPLKLIHSKQNLGFAKGNNLGIAHAKANTILLLNNDTLLVNDAVTIAYKRLYSQPSIGVVGAQLQYPDGELQKSAQRLPEIKYLLIELFRVQKLFSKEKAGKLLLGNFFNHQSAVEADWIWGTFFLFRRDVLKKLKGEKLPDDFFMYNEDMQWGVEFRRAGFKTVFEPGAKIIHLEGKNKFKTEMAEKNFSIIMNRYYGKPYHRVYRFLHNLVVRSSLKGSKS